MSGQQAATSPGAAGPESSSTAPKIIPARPLEPSDNDDSYEDAASSSASITSSILEYRAIRGRTYHSSRHPTEYFTPNDQQQQASVDCTHHYLTILLDGKLALAPIPNDIKSVLDVGTGTGVWALDFADEHPDAQVTGTDLSPIQPIWVPPNVKFEVDDATLDWTWPSASFDFVHMRYLFGAIIDWPALFRQAFRCCKPGGWVESAEVDVEFRSDDGTLDNNATLAKWAELYREGGKKTGRSFIVIEEDSQKRGMEAAGFTDIQVVNFKLPVGGWPQDPKLAEVGRLVQLTMENDLEGYTLLVWHTVMGWPQEEYPEFIAAMRRILKTRSMHGYMALRYVYGHKPQSD